MISVTHYFQGKSPEGKAEKLTCLPVRSKNPRFLLPSPFTPVSQIMLPSGSQDVSYHAVVHTCLHHITECSELLSLPSVTRATALHRLTLTFDL